MRKRLLPIIAPILLILVASAVLYPGYAGRTAAGEDGQDQVLRPSQLPTRLSDAEYWRLINDLSEAGGQFHSENFVSNEGTFQRLIPSLQSFVKPGGVYVGVGPEQNFSYIAALRPRIAFILDIRRQNMMQHFMYKAIFEQAPTRVEFFSLLFSRGVPAGVGTETSTPELFDRFTAMPADEARFKKNLADVFRVIVDKHGFPITSADSASLAHVYRVFFEQGAGIRYSTPRDGGRVPYVSLRDMLSAPDTLGINRSFLGDEANYSAVRERHLANLIVPVVGDFAGPKALRAIGNYVRGANETISAFYVSNVESYLFGENRSWRGFYDNIATLPLDSASIFIRPPSSAIPSTVATHATVQRDVDRTFGSIQKTLALVRSGSITRFSQLFLVGR